MSFYRTLLLGLLLAVLGALAWQFLAPDLGEVLVRWHGRTLTTTVAFFLVAWGLLWFALATAWALIRLPFNAWRRLARRQARNRLLTGLTALHQGRWARAESLLVKAAEAPEARAIALLAARDAARGRGDPLAAVTHQSALARHDPLAAALTTAETLHAQKKPQEVLLVLQPLADKNALPPHGLLLHAQALAAHGRAHEAFERIAVLRAEQALPADALAALEIRFAAEALNESATADVLGQRWQEMPTRLQESADIVSAYARRAAALGLDESAGNAIVQALDRDWDNALVMVYGQLPAGHDRARAERAERWLATQPDNPALLLCLGRLGIAQHAWSNAESTLHRAIAHGAGSEAWEALGLVFSAQDDAASAQIAYANALRSQRGESLLVLSGRSLREQIASEAVAEQRNEHGMPQLPR